MRPDDRIVHLSSPGIHCAGCLTAVGRTLSDLPDMHAARVDLTLKQVTLDDTPDVTPARAIARPEAAG